MRYLPYALPADASNRASRAGFRLFRALKFFAVVFLLAVFGAAAEGPARAADGRDVRFSQWQAADGDAPAPAPARVGSFSVARPAGEKILAGWRQAAWARALDDVKNALPARNAAEYLRQSAREKWLYNRDPKTLSAWWRDVQWQNVGLNLLQRTADFGVGEWLNILERNAGGMAFVRTLEADFTPALGERRWQLGLNAVGGFRETDDDVLAWQLRAYGSQKSSRGGNIGLIYRRILPAAAGGLAGVNVFLDYEHHGGYNETFLRWSLGAEYRAARGGLDVNWYFPLSDAAERADAYIYSRRGWDARLLLAGPAAWVDGALTYYHWRGRFGDGDDTGLRYGLRFSPPAAPGLRLDVEYDAGDKAREWSGRLSWLYRINEAQVSAPAAAAAFDARENFYNPVRREYGQRIRLVEKAEDLAEGAALFVTLTAVRGEGVGRAPGLTLTAAAALAGVQMTGARVTAGGAALSWRVAATATIFSAAGSRISLAAGAPAPWAMMLGENTGISLSHGGRQINLLTGTITFQRAGESVERLMTPGAMVRLLGTTINIGWDGAQSHVMLKQGVASLAFSGGGEAAAAADAITILRTLLDPARDDENALYNLTMMLTAATHIEYMSAELQGYVPDSSKATLLLPDAAAINIGLAGAAPPLRVGAGQTGVIATLTASGGNPPMACRLEYGGAAGVEMLEMAGGTILISLTEALGAGRDLTVTVLANDANIPAKTGEYRFGILTYAGLRADGATATVAANAAGEVGVVAAAGGDGAYAYALNADDAALELATAARGGGRVGVLLLATPLGASQTLKATIIATDNAGGRAEAPVRIVSRALPALAGGLRMLGATQSGAVYTLQATGGDGAYSYALAAGTDARVSLSASDTDADGRQKAVLSLTAGLGGDVVLRVEVSVTDGDNLSAGAIVTLSAHAGLLAEGVTATLAADATGAVGTISAQGGGGAYAYALNTDNAALALATESSGGVNVGALRLVSALGASQTLEAVVTVTDEVGGRVEAPVRIVSRSLPSLPDGLRTLGATQSGNVFTLTATGGDGTYSYALAAGTDARVSLAASDTDGDGKDNAVLSLTAELGDGVALQVEVSVTDGDGLSASGIVTLSAYAGLLAEGVTATVAADDTGEVGVIAAAGGDGSYSYALHTDNAALALATEARGGVNVGALRLVSALGASQRLEATVTVTDEVGGRIETPVRIVSRPLPSLPGGLRELGATQSGAVYTLQATGGDGTYSYALAAGTDARVSLSSSDTDSDGKDNAVLLLTAGLGGNIALLVTLSVTDGDGLSDAGIVTLSAHAGLLAEGVTTTLAADNTGAVGTINAQGGGGAYAYALNTDNATLALATESSGGVNIGALRLIFALGASQVLEATVIVTDEVGGRVESPVRIVSRSLPSLDGGLRRLGATESGAAFTLQAAGGDGSYSYALSAETDARISLSSSDTDSDGKNNAVLSLTAGLGGNVTLLVTIGVADGDSLSDSAVVTLSSYAALAAAGFSAEVASDDTGEAGIIAADGGDGDYSFALNSDNAALALRTEERGGENVGVVVLNSALGASQTAEATVTVTDGVGGEVEALVTISSRSLPSLPGGLRRLGATESSAVFTLQAAGGDGAYSYALAAGTDARAALAQEDAGGGLRRAVLSLPAALGGEVDLLVTISVTDGDELSDAATVTLSTYAALAASGFSVEVASDDTGEAGVISADGGDGVYTFALHADNAALTLRTEARSGENVGVVVLDSALGASQTAEATVTVTDGVGGEVEALVTISSRSLPSLPGGLRALGATQSGAVYTLQATGGDGSYSYAAAAGTDARAALSEEDAGGGLRRAVLSLPAALGGEAALLVTLSVTDGDGLSDSGIVTLSSYAALAAAGFSAEVASDDTGEVSIIAADGGDGVYAFALNADNAVLVLRTEERGGENVGVLSLDSALGASQTAEATVTVTDGVGGTVEALVTISSRSLPSLPGGLRELGATQSGNVFTLTATGGNEEYTYALVAGTDARVSLSESDTDSDGKDNAVLSLTAALGGDVALEVQVTVTDGDGLSDSAVVTLSTYAALAADGVTATLAADYAGAVGAITPAGGNGVYAYALNADNDRLTLATIAGEGVLSLTAALGASQELAATVTVTDGVGGTVEAVVTLSSYAVLAAAGFSAEVASDDTGEVSIIAADGGDGVYAFALHVDNAALTLRTEERGGENVGVLVLDSALGASQTAEATVTVTDGVGGEVEALVTISSRSLPSLPGGLRTLGATESGAVFTLQATGGDGAYSYALAAGTDARVALSEEDAGGLRRAVLSLPDALGGDVALLVTLSVTDGDGLSDSGIVTLSSYAALAAAGFSAEVASDDTGEVSIIAADGGDGVYAFALHADNAALALRTEERGGENVGVVVLNSALGASQTAEATVTVTDGVGGEVEALVTISSRSLPSLPGGLRELGATQSGEVYTLTATGGDEEYIYALATGTDARVSLAAADTDLDGKDNAILSLTAALGDGVALEVQVRVTDGDGLSASGIVTLSAHAGLRADGVTATVATDDTGPVGTINAQGGDGVYAYALNTDNPALVLATETSGGVNAGALRLASTLGASQVLEATVTVTDEVGGRVEAPVRIVSRSLPSLPGGLHMLGATQSGEVYTLQAAGGDGVYSYALAAGTDARVSLSSSDTDSDGKNNAVLSLTAALGGDVALPVTIGVTDGDGLSDSGVVTLSSYAALAAAGFSAEVASDDTGEVSIIAADGGDGVYAFALHADNAALALRTEERGGENVGVLVLNSALGASQTAEATVTVTDGGGGEVEALVTISSRSLPSLSGGLRRLGATQSGDIYTLQAAGGDGSYSYAPAADTDARVALAARDTDGDGADNAVLSLSDALGGEVALAVTLSVTDGDSLSAGAAVTLSTYAALTADGVTVMIGDSAAGAVARITPSGGDGDYRYALHADDGRLELVTLRGGADLSLTVSLGAARRLSATVTVTDGVGGEALAPVVITTRGILSLGDDITLTLRPDRSGIVHTIQATGGHGSYEYYRYPFSREVVMRRQLNAGGGEYEGLVDVVRGLGPNRVFRTRVHVVDVTRLARDDFLLVLTTYAYLSAEGVTAVIEHDRAGSVGVITPAGGDYNYAYSLHTDNPALTLAAAEGGVVLSLTAALGEARALQATVNVTDGIGGEVAAAVSLFAYAPLRAEGASVTIGGRDAGEAARITPSGGIGAYSYALHTNDNRLTVVTVNGNAALSLTAFLGYERLLSATLTVTDGIGGEVLAAVRITTRSLLSLGDDIAVTIGARTYGDVHTLRAQGGAGDYTYEKREGSASVVMRQQTNAESGAREAVLSVPSQSGLGAHKTLPIRVRVTDGAGESDSADVTITTRAFLRLSDDNTIRVPAGRAIEIYTLQATGGNRDNYLYVSDNESLFVISRQEDTDGDGANNGVLSLTAPLEAGYGERGAIIIVSDGDFGAHDEHEVYISAYERLSADDVTAAVAHNYAGVAATINVRGGDGDYRYRLNADNGRLELITIAGGAVARLSEALGAERRVSATVTVFDGAGSLPAEAAVVISARAALAFEKSELRLHRVVDFRSGFYDAEATGGDGDYRYALEGRLNPDGSENPDFIYPFIGFSEGDRNGNGLRDARLTLNRDGAPDLTGREITLTISARDGDGLTARQIVRLMMHPLLAVAPGDVGRVVGHHVSGGLATLRLSGGIGSYLYSFHSDDERLRILSAEDALISEVDDAVAVSNYADEIASGEVRLGSDTLTLELTEALGPEVRLSATLTAFGSIEGADIIAIRITSGAVLNLPVPATIAADAPVEQGRALHTLTADGGIGNYAYAIAGAVPASATAYVAINAAGEISQAKQIAAPFTATITFRVESGSETAQATAVLDWRAQNFATRGGQLLIIGGEEADSSDANTFADVWVSAADNTAWTELTVSAVLQPRRTFSKRITRAAALNNTVYVIGGRIGRSRSGGETTGEVWSSTDGRIWIPRLTAAFLNRDGHQLVTHRGSLYVIGGAAGDAPAGDNAIWASADGINWEERNRNTPAEDNLPPIFKHGAASHNGTLFVVGGDARIGGGAARANLNVWASADDGETWATVAAFPGSLIYPNVVSYRGVLYVIGGGRHDVWWSVDGKVWDKHPDFPSAGHRNAVSDAVALWRGDELLLIGGRRFNQRVNDIYSTTDGKTWTHEGAHPFTARSGAGFALFEPRASVEDLSAPDVARRVRSLQTGAVATIQAAGGYGGYTYALAALPEHNMTLATINGAGVINLTGALGHEATAVATVIVQDEIGWRADAVVSITTARCIILEPAEARIAVTAGATGAVLTLQAEDGEPPYGYNMGTAPGITLVTTDADGAPLDINGDGLRDAVLSLTAPLAGGVQLGAVVNAFDTDKRTPNRVVLISAYYPLRAGGAVTAGIGARQSGVVATITAAGGKRAAYEYAYDSLTEPHPLRLIARDTDEDGFMNAVVSLTAPLGAGAALEGTVRVTDGTGAAANAALLLTVYAPLALPAPAKINAEAPAAAGSVWGALAAAGGGGDYTYAVAGAVPASAAAYITINAAGEVLQAKQIGAAFKATITFQASAGGDTARAAVEIDWRARDFAPASGHMFIAAGDTGSPARVNADVWASAGGGAWRLVTDNTKFRARETEAAALNGTLYLAGGADAGEVWASADGGRSWGDAPLADLPSFVRSGYQFVAHAERLYFIGGRIAGGGVFNAVYSSDDGADWIHRNENTAEENNLPALRDHAAASHNGRLFVIGGIGGGGRVNNVYASDDGGATWQTTAENMRFLARDQHAAVSFRGLLYIIGGYRRNDVWWSVDGAEWDENPPLPFGDNTDELRALRHGDKLYLIVGGFKRGGLNNIWSTTDGKTWREEGHYAFANRAGAGAAVVAPSPSAFSAAGATVTLNSDAAGVVGTVKILNGFGAYGYSLNTDGGALTLATIAGDGVLSLTAALGGAQLLSATVIVTNFIGGGATAAVEITTRVWTPVSAEDARVTAHAPRPAGGTALHKLRADGGSGAYEYEIISVLPATAAVYVGVSGGGLVQISAIREPLTATITVQANSAGARSDRAQIVVEWRRRDYPPARGNMFVAAGSDGSNLADVWFSNGRGSTVWTRLTAAAAFGKNGAPQMAALNNALHIAGGADERGRESGGVHSSHNGAAWVSQASLTAFARSGHRLVAHNGELYFAGGARAFNSNIVLYNGVWASADGRNWTRRNENSARNYPARFAHGLVSHNGSLFVIGGIANPDGGEMAFADYGNDAYYRNDVWASADGREWDLLAGSAAFSPRGEFAVVSFRGLLYVIGGRDGDDVFSEVWSSVDGITWREEDAPPFARRGHAALAQGDDIYVIGGAVNAGLARAELADGVIWTSRDGARWRRLGGDSPYEFSRRVFAAAAAADIEPPESLRPPLEFGGGETVYVRAGMSGGAHTVQAAGGDGDYAYAPFRPGGVAIVGAPVSLVYGDANGDGFQDVVLSLTAAMTAGAVADVLLFGADGRGAGMRGERVIKVSAYAPLALPAPATINAEAPAAAGRVWRRLAAAGGIDEYGYSYTLAGAAPASAAVYVTVNAAGEIVQTKQIGEAFTATMTFEARSGELTARAVAVMNWRRRAAAPVAGQMFIIGGSPASGSADVWASAAGNRWQLVTDAAFPRRSTEAAALNNTVYVAGGLLQNPDDLSQRRSTGEVFASTDGAGWTPLVSPDYLNRDGHRLITHRGSLYFIGGLRYQGAGLESYNAVYASGDGRTWARRNRGGDNNLPEVFNHGAASHNGSLFVVGGQYQRQDSPGNFAGIYHNAVWASADDGATWQEVAGEDNLPRGDNGVAFLSRQGHAAVSFRGLLYVIGGSDGCALSDVWWSVDGRHWDKHPVALPFGGRAFMTPLVRGNRLYLIGGGSGCDGGAARQQSDIWSTSDFQTWRAEGDYAFAARRRAAGAVFTPDASVFGLAAPGATVLIGGLSAGRAATITATGGDGDYRYHLNADNPNLEVATVHGEGVVVINKAAGPERILYATMTVLDGAGDEVAAAVEISTRHRVNIAGPRFIPLPAPLGHPDVYAGNAVLTMTAQGGDIDYRWSFAADSGHDARAGLREISTPPFNIRGEVLKQGGRGVLTFGTPYLPAGRLVEARVRVDDGVGDFAFQTFRLTTQPPLEFNGGAVTIGATQTGYILTLQARGGNSVYGYYVRSVHSGGISRFDDAVMRARDPDNDGIAHGRLELLAPVGGSEKMTIVVIAETNRGLRAVDNGLYEQHWFRHATVLISAYAALTADGVTATIGHSTFGGVVKITPAGGDGNYAYALHADDPALEMATVAGKGIVRLTEAAGGGRVLEATVTVRDGAAGRIETPVRITTRLSLSLGEDKAVTLRADAFGFVYTITAAGGEGEYFYYLKSARRGDIAVTSRLNAESGAYEGVVLVVPEEGLGYNRAIPIVAGVRDGINDRAHVTLTLTTYAALSAAGVTATISGDYTGAAATITPSGGDGAYTYVLRGGGAHLTLVTVDGSGVLLVTAALGFEETLQATVTVRDGTGGVAAVPVSLTTYAQLNSGADVTDSLPAARGAGDYVYSLTGGGAPAYAYAPERSRDPRARLLRRGRERDAGHKNAPPPAFPRP